MKKANLNDLQFELAVLRCFRENLRNTPSGLPRIIQDFPFTWRWFWREFRMPKTEFNRRFVALVDLTWRSNRSYRLNVYGAPPSRFTKTNWIEYRGKHYVLWGLDEVAR